MMSVEVGDCCNFRCTGCESSIKGETMFALMTERHVLAHVCLACAYWLRDTMVKKILESA